MSDEQQPVIGGTVAGGTTTPTPTPTGTGQTEDWEGRYKGASKKMDEFQKDATKYKAQVTDLMAEIEGLRSEKKNEVTDWQNRYQTVEQKVAEQTKKLAEYERKEKLRSLINTDDFAELAPEFEKDKIFQFGLMTAAEQMDEAALKAELAKSLQVRKGRQAQAVGDALAGATPTPPATGTTTGATEEQLASQIRAERDPVKREALFEKLARLRDRQT